MRSRYRLLREPPWGLVLEVDGARRVVPGVNVGDHADAGFDDAGDRAWWYEAELFEHAPRILTLRVFYVRSHEGGEDRVETHRLSTGDDGLTWSPAPMAPVEGMTPIETMRT